MHGDHLEPEAAQRSRFVSAQRPKVNLSSKSKCRTQAMRWTSTLSIGGLAGEKAIKRSLALSASLLHLGGKVKVEAKSGSARSALC